MTAGNWSILLLGGPHFISEHTLQYLIHIYLLLETCLFFVKITNEVHAYFSKMPAKHKQNIRMIFCFASIYLYQTMAFRTSHVDYVINHTRQLQLSTHLSGVINVVLNFSFLMHLVLSIIVNMFCFERKIQKNSRDTHFLHVNRIVISIVCTMPNWEIGSMKQCWTIHYIQLTSVLHEFVCLVTGQHNASYIVHTATFYDCGLLLRPCRKVRWHRCT